ncbi:transcriptional regulator BsdA [Lentibacillus halophilus]|uniref:Transcriptional regulator BsdA n=1 Tax=Lentibacillus halophilus TaxID=295065 RepID=A0ABP3J6L1_9BACI
MDIRQLNYFYTIANEGQITRAAKKLHMAQPPLSQTLKSLEDELGVTLLERNGRQMELTKAGMVLYEKAENIFHFLDETAMEVKETGKGFKGKLSIGCVKSCFSKVVHPIKEFRSQFPEVNIDLREGDTSRLTELLHNREIDLAVVRHPLEMKSFSSHDLSDEDYVVIAPESWHLGNYENEISLNELAGLPLLLLHRITGVGQYEVIMNQFENKGLEPNIVGECPDVDMILGLVHEAIGATIIPESAIKERHQDNIRKLQIKDTTIISKSSIIWLKDRYISKSVRSFIDLF